MVFLPLFVTACRSRLPDVHTVTPIAVTGESSQSHSLKLIVQDSEWDKLIVVNSTATDILIPYSISDPVGEKTFRFYRKTPIGWERMQPMPDIIVPPLANDPGVVISAQNTSTLNLGLMGAYQPYLGVPLTGTFMIQVRYRFMNSESEKVQYSNEFSVDSQQTISRTDVELSYLPPEPLRFTLRNNSLAPIWFIDVCTSRYIDYGSDDGFLSLQRLTDEGTWQVIRGDCNQVTDPIRINSKQTTTIDGGQWFNKKIKEAGAGVYRWEVVIYLSYDVSHNDPVLRYGHHIFSQTFEYSP